MTQSKLSDLIEQNGYVFIEVVHTVRASYSKSVDPCATRAIKQYARTKKAYRIELIEVFRDGIREDGIYPCKCVYKYQLLTPQS